MEYGICELSVVPVRAEASDKAEMVSQVLFGETMQVLLKKSPWVRVKLSYDGYEGWIDEKQYLPIKDDYYNKLQQTKSPVALDMMNAAVSANRHLSILIGSDLPDFDGMNFKLKKEKMVYNGQAIDSSNIGDPTRLLRKVALRYLNAPYLWGGRSPFGIDCSGFTQQVFKLLGIALPRDAYQQIEYGKPVDFIDTAREGDVAFFENKEGRVHHVGIVLADKQIIHASGQVRIDILDHYGIHRKQGKKYSHKLTRIKRLL